MTNEYFRIEKNIHNTYFLNDNNIQHVDMGDSLYIPKSDRTEELLSRNKIDFDFFIDLENKFKPLIDNPEHKIMLTVKDVMDYLKDKDPNSLVLIYEPNSFAYISQFKDPKMSFVKVSDAKIEERKYWEKFYKGNKNKEKIVNDKVEELFRYSRNNDIIMKV